MSPTKIWLWAALGSLIVEVVPPPTHFTLLAVAFGALGAAIVTVYSTSLWLPWTVFVVVSLILMPVFVPLARFLFTPKPSGVGVQGLVGQRAQVTDPFSPAAPGAVLIQSDVWRAVSESGSFTTGEWVVVESVEGTHVLIKPAS